MADKTAPRLKARYTEQVRPALREEFQHRNVMEIPRVVKVVVNMGVGEAAHDSKMIEGAVRDLAATTGRRRRRPHWECSADDGARDRAEPAG